MAPLFPLLLIAIGVIVLLFGRRLAVLGAAVGALVGVGLLHLFPSLGGGWMDLLIVGGLAILGFIGGRVAKAFEEIIVMVFGALGGAAVAIAFLDLLNLETTGLDWVLALVGGIVGLVLARRFRFWTLAILSGLIGGLLIVRGLISWLPALDGGIGTLLVLVFAGGGTWYQGRGLREPAAEAQTPAPAPAAAAAPESDMAPKDGQSPPPSMG